VSVYAVDFVHKLAFIVTVFLFFGTAVSVLCLEQSSRISSQSDFKRWSLGFFEEVAPTITTKRTTTRRTR